MVISVRNHAGIVNRPIRFLKWKLCRLHGKFNRLIDAAIYSNKEGSGKSPLYEVLLELGVPVPDITIKHSSTDLELLMARSSQDAHRYLARMHQ